MDKKPEGAYLCGVVVLGLGMIICCVCLTLLAAGALGGVGAWLFDGGLTWLALAAVLGVAGGFLLRRHAGAARASGASRQAHASNPVRGARTKPSDDMG